MVEVDTMIIARRQKVPEHYVSPLRLGCKDVVHDSRQPRFQAGFLGRHLGRGGGLSVSNREQLDIIDPKAWYGEFGFFSAAEFRNSHRIAEGQ